MPALSEESLAVCSWSLQPKDARSLIDAVQTLGLRRTQLHLNPLVEDDNAGWADAPDALRDAGVAVVSGMLTTRGEDYTSLDSIRRTGGVVPDEHWDANLATAEAAARLAGQLGLPIVSLHAGFIPHDPADPSFAVLRDRVATLADRFADHGGRLLLETGQETADGLTAFLDRLDHPSVGVNFDPANMLLYGMGDPIAALRRLLPRVGQAHIKDAKPSPTPGRWGEEVVVGTGSVPWAEFVAVLQAAGYAGDLVIEREAGDARLDDVAAAAAHVGALL